MAGLTRWLALLVAPFLLTSCLLVPAKFVSTLDIRADRTFTYTYVGEVLLPKSKSPAEAEPSEDGMDSGSNQSWQDDGEGDPVMLKIAAKKKGKAAKPEENFGDSPDDATQLKRLAEILKGEYGYRSVRYVGSRKLAIDYRVSGTLDHAFVFPFNPDGEVFVPFLAIELRGKDRLRIKAPGFANDENAAGSMGGMGGMGGMSGGDNASQLDGTFTLTTNAQVVSQNQEDGAQVQADGGKTLIWTVNPNTRDAPMAVLRVNPLP